MNEINKPFGDISLKNAMIAWNAMRDGWYGEPGKVIVIPHPDSAGYCNHLKVVNTTGACITGWKQLDTTEQLCNLFIEAWYIICRDGVRPKAMHDALMVIPEYRKTWNGEALFISNS